MVGLHNDKPVYKHTFSGQGPLYIQWEEYSRMHMWILYDTKTVHYKSRNIRRKGWRFFDESSNQVTYTRIKGPSLIFRSIPSGRPFTKFSGIFFKLQGPIFGSGAYMGPINFTYFLQVVLLIGGAYRAFLYLVV